MLNGVKPEIKVSEFDPIPMDKYTVQCVDVNLIKQNKFQSSEEEDVLNYKFAILDDKPMEVTDAKGEKVQGSTRGRFLWKRCRLAINNRSWLGKLAKAVVGRDLTKQEIADFDAESIVGKQVDVLVEQIAKDEKVYVNIASFNKTLKNLDPMKESEIKKVGQVVEKQTVSATAPDAGADEEADKLVSDMKQEELTASSADEETTEDEDDVAVMEAKLKLAKAKAKAAKAAQKA